MIALIVAVLGMLALYSNYQKLRRDQIEKVTITAGAPADTTPSPTASPATP